MTVPGISPEQEAALGTEASGGGGKPSQATRLVALADAAELFHAPDSAAYATFDVDGHRETCPLKSKSFKRWLQRAYYEQERSAPGSQAVQDALGVLEGRAIYDGVERPVYVRLAEHDSAVYLDLGNPEWSAVEVTPAGWRVVDEPPVRFRRPRGMATLPRPVRGGALDDLRPFLNLGSKEDWILVASWAINALRPIGPYPTLVLHGEQGTAKSTTARVLRSLVDPHTAPLRAEPREGRDLMIAATNGWVMAFDNLSHLQPWLSDALCRLATGGGFATRELYSDSDEAIFDAQRPVILNGIEELATRGDLLDRSLILHQPVITDDHRRAEDDFNADFDRARPRILGALLDATARALDRLPSVHLAELPRMADFAKWITAAEAATSWESGAFLSAYGANRASAHDLALESSLISEPVRALAGDGGFEGTHAELLQRLELMVGDDLPKRRGWPKTAQRLSADLSRIAPNLRAVGVVLERERRSRQRIIRIRTGPQNIVIGVTERHRARLNDGDDGDDGESRAYSNARTLEDDEDERIRRLADEVRE